MALERADIERLLWERAQKRCDELSLERTTVKENLLESGEHEWLEGFDKITPTSVDLLCVTLYYPIPGGN